MERFRLCVFRPVICVGTGLGPLVWTRHPFEQRHHPSPGCGASMDLGTPATKHWDVPSGGGKAPNRRISLEKSSNYGGLSLDCPCLLTNLTRELYNPHPI